MDADDPTPRRRALKGCAWTLGLLLAALTGLPFLAGDEPETIPDPRREIPAEENAYVGLVEAGDDVDESGLQPGYPVERPSERPDVLQYLTDNAAALDAIDEALTRPHCAVPKRPPEAMLSPVWGSPGGKLREAARLKMHRGYRRLELGDIGAAVRDMLDVVEMGSRLATAGGHAIDYFVANGVEAMGLTTLRRGLRTVPAEVDTAERDPTVSWPTHGWTDEEKQVWRAALAVLLRWDEEPAAMKTALAGEYHFVRAGFLEPQRAGFDGALPYPTVIYMPQSTVREARAVFEEAIRRADLPYWERDPSRIEPAAPTGFNKLLNRVGRKYLSMTGVAGKMLPRLDGRRAKLNVTIGHIAIKLYLEDHGRLPRDWAELVDGGYLPEAPLDPFSGQPLIYRPREGLVYSVAEDGNDNGGIRGPEPCDLGDRLLFVTGEKGLPRAP